MNLDEIKCGTCLNFDCEGFVKCDSCSKWECFECITEDTDDDGCPLSKWFCVDCWDKNYPANDPSLGYFPTYTANMVVIADLTCTDPVPGNSLEINYGIGAMLQEFAANRKVYSLLEILSPDIVRPMLPSSMFEPWLEFISHADSVPASMLDVRFDPVTSTSPLPQFEYNPIIVSPKQYDSMMRDGRNIVDAWAESHRLHADMHAKMAPLDVSSVAIMSNPNKSNIAIFSVDMDRTPTHGYLTCNSCGYHIDVEDYSIVGSVLSCVCLNQYQNTVAGWEFIGNLHIGDTQTHRKGIEPLVKDVPGVTYCALCDNESTHAKMDSGKLCYECRSRA